MFAVFNVHPKGILKQEKKDKEKHKVCRERKRKTCLGAFVATSITVSGLRRMNRTTKSYLEVHKVNANVQTTTGAGVRLQEFGIHVNAILVEDSPSVMSLGRFV